MDIYSSDMYTLKRILYPVFQHGGEVFQIISSVHDKPAHGINRQSGPWLTRAFIIHVVPYPSFSMNRADESTQNNIRLLRSSDQP